MAHKWRSTQTQQVSQKRTGTQKAGSCISDSTRQGYSSIAQEGRRGVLLSIIRKDSTCVPLSTKVQVKELPLSALQESRGASTKLSQLYKEGDMLLLRSLKEGEMLLLRSLITTMKERCFFNVVSALLGRIYTFPSQHKEENMLILHSIGSSMETKCYSYVVSAIQEIRGAFHEKSQHCTYKDGEHFQLRFKFQL